MIGAFEQTLLALMIFVIMLGMGAALTVNDFTSALRRPYGLVIGLVSQYGFLPVIGFLLAVTLPLPPEIAIGLVVMSCMPGGTTSNMFTYFAKANLALSVLMTVNSTVVGVVAIPVILLSSLALLRASGVEEAVIPASNVVVTIILMLLPVVIGMAIRRWNANYGALAEIAGSALAVLFIVMIIVTWIPRNWGFLMATSLATYVAVIGLGLLGFLAGYLFSMLLKLHPRDARTISLEIGIQNGPLALAVVAFSFPAAMQQVVSSVPVLYSLFIVISATLLTLWFRRANEAAEQKIPRALL